MNTEVLKSRIIYMNCQYNALSYKVVRKLKKKLNIKTKKSATRYNFSLMSCEDTQRKIGNLITEGKLFMVGKIDGVEGDV